MKLVNPRSIQRHPLVWGWLWAALTMGLIWIVDYARGETLPNLLITIPMFAVAGAVWGYSMKWFFDRREGAE
jgi:hypothetical protein